MAMPVDQRFLDQIALSRQEYELIVARLGRETTEEELGMFGALWSVHFGYKNSRPLLRLLPEEGPYVLTRRGTENAGAVDIGDGLCVVMKIESHNHPSAIEPYQGAAPGVGGVGGGVFPRGGGGSVGISSAGGARPPPFWPFSPCGPRPPPAPPASDLPPAAPPDGQVD